MYESLEILNARTNLISQVCTNSLLLLTDLSVSYLFARYPFLLFYTITYLIFILRPT